MYTCDLYISLVQQLRSLFEKKGQVFKSHATYLYLEILTTSEFVFIFGKYYESLSVFISISERIHKTNIHIWENPYTNPESI